jgi:anti-sigma factor RsiW
MPSNQVVDCARVRLHLLDHLRGRLAPLLADQVQAHLAGCLDCRRDAAQEEVVTELLESRLPQHPASLALKRRLAAAWPDPAPLRPATPPAWWSRWRRPELAALAVGLLLLATAPLYYERVARPRGDVAALVTEAVNDHLRVLSSPHPLDVESGGVHQVKPWFEGKLDFAPEIPFAGDADFPLRGGTLGYFLDRRAAVVVYQRRLHAVTLLVFRVDGLAWPSRGLEPMGQIASYGASSRGFNVLLWRAGDLGYALVSDLGAAELRELGAKLGGAS